MGTFLLFDPGNRLIQVEDRAGCYEAFDPRDVFFPREDPKRDAFHALELHPAVLQRIRPDVFRELYQHATITRAGLKVDRLEDIQRRLTRWRIMEEEAQLVETASRIVTLHQAELLLKSLPESARTGLETLEAHLGVIQVHIHDLREGLRLAVVPQTLVDLAGKMIPI